LGSPASAVLARWDVRDVVDRNLGDGAPNGLGGRYGVGSKLRGEVAGPGWWDKELDPNAEDAGEVRGESVRNAPDEDEDEGEGGGEGEGETGEAGWSADVGRELKGFTREGLGGGCGATRVFLMVLPSGAGCWCILRAFVETGGTGLVPCTRADAAPRNVTQACSRARGEGLARAPTLTSELSSSTMASFLSLVATSLGVPCGPLMLVAAPPSKSFRTLST